MHMYIRLYWRRSRGRLGIFVSIPDKGGLVGFLTNNESEFQNKDMLEVGRCGKGCRGVYGVFILPIAWLLMMCLDNGFPDFSSRSVEDQTVSFNHISFN